MPVTALKGYLQEWPRIKEELLAGIYHPQPASRHSWLQVARGSVDMNGQLLEAGDGAAASDEHQLIVTGKEKAEVLLFDLA